MEDRGQDLAACPQFDQTGAALEKENRAWLQGQKEHVRSQVTLVLNLK
jgi:hypothetical protein